MMKRFVEEYGFDDAYIDIYHFGPQCDYAHKYEQYPFFPFIVGLNEHLLEWADFLHKRGMSFTVNAPHPASALSRFGDIITADAGDLTLFPLWFKTRCGTRLNGNLGSLCWRPNPDKTERFSGEIGLFRFNFELSLFNGAFPRGNFYDSTNQKWRVEDEQIRAAQMALWNRNMAFAWNVAQARLVGGEPFRHYVYLHSDGTIFVAIRNGKIHPEKRCVRLNLHRLGLEDDTDCYVFEWDVDEGATFREANLMAEALAQGLYINLEPEETKFLVIFPICVERAASPFVANNILYEQASGMLYSVIQTDFLAFFPLNRIYTSFSTAQILNATEEDGRMNLEISAVPHRESITRFHIPPGKHPQISVTDSLESSIVWSDEDCVEVSVKHSEKTAKIELLME